MTTAVHASTIDWPAFEAVAAERVLAGSPTTSTLALREDERVELGFWQVTPGEFTTIRAGFDEFITVLEGEGDLIHDDGTVYPLRAGATLLLEDGWSGRWVIRQTLTKSYTIVHAG
jgi:uncharacterized cupin superfamily protein